MNIILNLRHYLLDLSPGIPAFKQASKTILGILITLFLLRNETLGLQLLAAICTGMSIQTVSATPFLLRLYQMIIYDLLFISVFYLGYFVKNSELLTIVFLTGLGFTVNYCKSYVLERSPAPFMIWLLGFIATLLPTQDFSNFTTPLLSFLYGFGVSIPFILFLFPPPDPLTLFQNNKKKLFLLLGQGISELMSPNFEKQNMKKDVYRICQRLEKRMYSLLSLNQRLLDSIQLNRNKPHQLKVLQISYALVNVYAMLVHSLNRINTVHLSPDMNEAVHANSIQILNALSYLSSKRNIAFKSTMDSMTLINMMPMIVHQKMDQTEMISPLIQVSHCFELMKSQIEQLLRGGFVDA
ncbi:hypothetical protein [Legionella waltersii]|uniref:FUSC family protein n=1 Tax=Legionella waltersii TaxID=66969 RepID=A0A0W1AAL3_9GAMM|nr:hypothetical protein [Legionella waltersii]KTD78396.1 hypothetical protein Lwal_1831 [Legionella waltersii]SNV06264.1 Uncharacterised protein [Legionella waltersii]